MKFQLVIVKGPNTSKVLPLRTEVTTIGRQEDCQIRVVSSEVSRKHCQLLEKDGKLFVKDLNSSNGTFVNGRKISDQQLLGPGSQLTVGPLTFRIDRFGEAAPTAAKPSDTAPGAPSPALDATEAYSTPKAAPEIAEDDFALLLDDELGMEPAASSAPAAAGSGAKKPADDEFEIDFGDDPGQVTISSQPPPKAAAPPPAAKPAAAKPEPSKPSPKPAPPVSEDVEDAVADFLLDINVDE